MNRELAREIIACLRLSGSPKDRLNRLSSFTWDEWRRTLQWLDESGLALPFWQRMHEQGTEALLPKELSTALRRNMQDHRRRIRAMAEDVDSIHQAFDEAGIKYALLKGFAMIPEYCPVASARTTYDYDYLVAVSCLREAERALEEIGYRSQPPVAGQPSVYFHEARPPRSPLSRDDLYSAGFPRTLELHSAPWNPEELKIPLDLSANWLARRKTRTLSMEQLDMERSQRIRSGLRFSVLSEEDELLFQLLHAFRHILQDWCRLASLFDIAWFVEHRTGDTAFWQRFLDQVEPCPALRQISGVALALSERLFGATLARTVAAETTECLPSPIALWLRRYGYRSALDNFSSNKFSLLLYREFVRDASAWRAIQRRRLLPLHQPNRAAYTSSRAAGDRLAAKWSQSVYVARRLKHHALGAVRYGLEWLRWRHVRAATARHPQGRFGRGGGTFTLE